MAQTHATRTTSGTDKVRASVKSGADMTNELKNALHGMKERAKFQLGDRKSTTGASPKQALSARKSMYNSGVSKPRASISGLAGVNGMVGADSKDAKKKPLASSRNSMH